jgi:DNA-binding GntR family transcriptional regulator
VAAPRHLTKTELALHVLRERIAAGDLAPGARLRVEELAHDLEMSPTPVREALRLLQADGLVDYRAHYGIAVTEYSADEVRDLFRIRALLEPLAVELAVPRLGADELAELQRIHEQQEAAVRDGSGSAMSKTNADWHWAIYEAAGSQLLNEFIRRLWQAFPWRTMWALPGRSEVWLRQHTELMDAIRAGDAGRAAELMRVHITSGEEAMLAQLEAAEAAASVAP